MFVIQSLVLQISCYELQCWLTDASISKEIRIYMNIFAQIWTFASNNQSAFKVEYHFYMYISTVVKTVV